MTLVDAAGQSVAKVLVGVPCGPQVDAGFALDLALLHGYTTFVRPDMEVGLYFLKGTYLPRARAAIVTHALAHGYSHILWVDSDMRFPKDALLRLLGHAVPIVGANYVTRQPPILPLATDMDRQPVFHGERDLEDVRFCGMGLMLTETQVFAKMGKPYFAVGYNKQVDDYAPEDAFFCDQARRHGFRVQVDWPLSEQVRHAGVLEFTLDHGRMTLAAAVEQQQEQPVGA